MLAWLRRLFAPPAPPPPRLIALWNQVQDLDARADYLEGELKSLRGRLTGALRREKPPEDAPGQEIEEEAEPQLPPPRALTRGTAHLARRFKTGG